MGKQRVPRTRAGGTWTEARYKAFIRSALRGAWSRYPVKFQVLREDRKTVKGKKHKYEHKCNACKKWYPQQEIQVDHIEPCGGWDYDELGDWVQRLLCEPDDVQKLCKPCHQKKTNEERKSRGKGT